MKTEGIIFLVIVFIVPVITTVGIVLSLRKRDSRNRALREYIDGKSYEYIGSAKRTFGRISKIKEKYSSTLRETKKKHKGIDQDIRVYDIFGGLSDFGLADGVSRLWIRNLFRVPDDYIEQLVFEHAYVTGGKTTSAFETTLTAFKFDAIAALPIFDVQKADSQDKRAGENWIKLESHTEFSSRYSVFALKREDIPTIRRVFSDRVQEFLAKTDFVFIRCRKNWILIRPLAGGLLTPSTLWPIKTMDAHIKTTRRIVDLLLGR